MSSMFERRLVRPGTPIFVEGAPGDAAYVIERGRVDLCRLDGLRFVPLASLGPGEILGTLSPDGDQPHPFAAVAVAETELVVIAREMLRHRLQSSDPLLALLVRLLAERLPGGRHAPLPPETAGAVATDGALSGGAIAPAAALEHHRRVEAQHRLEAELRQAVARAELDLWLQPVVGLADARIVGFEALIRWRHPERGVIGPADFLALARRLGLMGEIDVWAIREACRLLRASARGDGGAAPFIAVNLAPERFADRDIIRNVKLALEYHDVDPSRLKLELTEAALDLHSSTAWSTAVGLKEIGIGLVLDDFGQPPTSLHALERLPLESLKLDRALIAGAVGEPRLKAMSAAIAGLARSLGLGLIGEAIERPEERVAAWQLGCRQGQGYLFSYPLHHAAAFDLYRRDQPLADPLTGP